MTCSLSIACSWLSTCRGPRVYHEFSVPQERWVTAVKLIPFSHRQNEMEVSCNS